MDMHVGARQYQVAGSRWRIQDDHDPNPVGNELVLSHSILVHVMSMGLALPSNLVGTFLLLEMRLTDRHLGHCDA